MRTNSVITKLESKIALCVESGFDDVKLSELGLCREFGVSRTTVRKAVQQLKSRGLLCSRKGSGLYIRNKAISRRGLLKAMFIPFILCNRQWSDPRCLKAIMSLETAFQEKGMIFFPRTMPAPLKSISQLLDYFVPGKTLFALLSGDITDDFIMADPGRDAPHFILYGYYRPNAYHSVVCADIGAGCDRLLHCLDGKKKVALLNGVRHLWIHKQVLASFERYVRERKLRAGEFMIVHSAIEGGYGEALKIIGKLGESVGIITANNILAMGVYQAVAALGLKIPAQVAVTSIGETDVANSLAPGLTTLCLNENEMAHRTVEYIMQYLRGSGVKKTSRIMIQPEIIARHSTL